jgi:predicted DNA-binding protein with PD1-like motif
MKKITRIIISAFSILLLLSCHHKIMSTNSYVFRLKPGQDLSDGISNFVKEHNVQAGWISTCVGSLTDFTIRFANQNESSQGSGHFEIVSMTGTVSVNGSHVHISISDSTGKTIGGHLMPGCKIYTTAEIVIQQNDDLIFTREEDGTTPWKELQIKKRSN